MRMHRELVQHAVSHGEAAGTNASMCNFFISRLKIDQRLFCSNLNRGKGKGFQIITANITSWNSGLQAFREGGFGGADVVLLQAHRLNDRTRLLAARCQLERLGWRSFLKPEQKTEKNTSGGVGIAFAPWVSVVRVDLPQALIGSTSTA
jgi:hypothetical protein